MIFRSGESTTYHRRADGYGMSEAGNTTVVMHRELTLADGVAPNWIHILPLGPDVEGRDGRRFRIDDAAALVAAFDRDIIVDEDHESESWAGSTRASGWIRELRVVAQAEAGFDVPGIWGRVDWTPEGAECVKSLSYRFLSPAFYRWFDDDGVQHVAKLSSVALTNRPNLDLKALNRAGASAPNAPAEDSSHMKPEQLAALRASLGLAADASPDVVFVALNSRLATPAPIAAPNPDLVPKADLELALNRAKVAEESLAAHAKKSHDDAVNVLLDDAVKAGKVAPASKDHYRALCTSADGLKSVTALFASMPNLVGPAPTSTAPIAESGDGGAKVISLNAEEREVAKSLGLTEAQALENKKLHASKGGAA